MTRLLGSPAWCAALTLALAAAFFGVRIDLPFLEPEETRYAESRRQMLAHDQWLVPVHNGQDFLDKPPLLYWLVMASYQAFGPHEWSARLPTVVAAWLTVVVVLAWGWRTAGPWTGVAAAVVLTLCGDFVYRAPMLTMNGPLALFVTLSLAAADVACRAERFHWGWWIVSAAAGGLGVLTKGPVAFVLIAVPVVVWQWLDRKTTRPPWWSWLVWFGGSIAISGPWFVAVANVRPEFVDHFFWRHHVERFTTPFDHAGPMWQYLPQLAFGFLPWTLVAIWLVCRRRTENDAAVVSLGRRAFVAAVWGLLFFSLSGSKRPIYLVPVDPPFAVAAGAYFWNARTSLSKPIWLGLGGASAAALVATMTFWLPGYSRDHSVADVVPVVPPDLPVLCYGHGWDGIGFRLQRDDVKEFLGERRHEVAGELAKHPRSLVFVTTKREGDDFESLLPAGARFRVVAECRQARVGFVEP